MLGTVQGAALRSARAYARPSGLDGACAQMIGGHLRDGRRILLPSGTNGAVIDPSDGLEKRSYMFDRFRTGAFRPLVEVHFSRFCPLTIVVSGANLFALTGAATHQPPLSVTDVEQPLIVALRASINSYPATSRETIGDAHADLQSPSVIQCTVGDREDSTTNYSVQVERFDSQRSLIGCEQPSGSAPRSPMSVSGPHQRF